METQIKERLYEDYFGKVKEVVYLSYPLEEGIMDSYKQTHDFFSWTEEKDGSTFIGSFRNSNMRDEDNGKLLGDCLVYRLNTGKNPKVSDFVNYPSGEDHISPHELCGEKILLDTFGLSELDVARDKKKAFRDYESWAYGYGTTFIEESERFFLRDWLVRNAERRLDYTFGDYGFNLNKGETK